jgi:GH15 family glucan-1,4-alpha-glucosidase
VNRSLDLALIGNCQIGLLVDAIGTVVWGCFPRFDSDAVFCALLDNPDGDTERGMFAIDLIGMTRFEQHYLENTAVLITRLFDANGGAIEITDCAPRFYQHGRLFHPMTLARQVRRIEGNPRICIRLRPMVHYGAEHPARTVGSNHVRYVGPDLTLRLTTDASLTALIEERPVFLDDTITLLLGPDETVQSSVAEVGTRFIEETAAYWRDWVRRLAIPFEWQAAVIRAAITLQLNAFDDTGAIIAAMTTSIPEAAGSARNWDYRYCWLRDAYFVVDALNRLGATDTMERYLAYIVNVTASADSSRVLQPMFGINGALQLTEYAVPTLPGYRGMGPVRVGNHAYVQVQHDVYGSAILAAAHVFFDERLVKRGDRTLFERLEQLGRQALRVFDQPDAGIWELRERVRIHTFPSVMCWAACDRLARIAARLGLSDRQQVWTTEAARIREFILARCWNPQLNAFVGAADSDALDASLLLLADLGFIEASDPRFAGTVGAIEQGLKRGDFVFRYVEQDDFGQPQNAFVVCTFWYIEALVHLGRRDEARALFERLLARRNPHGLLSEHLDPSTGELWGNFVQTYSMVGLISCAIRLSISWDAAF